MYKATVELCRVHASLSLKLGVILEEDEIQKIRNRAMNWGNDEVIHKFAYRNNSYIRINPRPFLTIDITDKRSKKTDGYDPNYQLSFGQKGVFILKLRLRKLLAAYQSEKDLFYKYKSGELMVDRELANLHREVAMVTNTKSIILEPCVVQDENEKDLFYEGCIMAFNKMDYFTYLTYEEMLYLLDTLNTLDMTALALQLIDSEILYSALRDTGKIEELKIGEPIKEDPGLDNSPKFAIPKKANNIPEI